MAGGEVSPTRGHRPDTSRPDDNDRARPHSLEDHVNTVGHALPRPRHRREPADLQGIIGTNRDHRRRGADKTGTAVRRLSHQIDQIGVESKPQASPGRKQRQLNSRSARTQPRLVCLVHESEKHHATGQNHHGKQKQRDDPLHALSRNRTRNPGACRLIPRALPPRLLRSTRVAVRVTRRILHGHDDNCASASPPIAAAELPEAVPLPETPEIALTKTVDNRSTDNRRNRLPLQNRNNGTDNLRLQENAAGSPNSCHHQPS